MSEPPDLGEREAYLKLIERLTSLTDEQISMKTHVDVGTIVLLVTSIMQVHTAGRHLTMSTINRANGHIDKAQEQFRLYLNASNSAMTQLHHLVDVAVKNAVKGDE